MVYHYYELHSWAEEGVLEEVIFSPYIPFPKAAVYSYDLSFTDETKLLRLS
jgi:hypothetical protein